MVGDVKMDYVVVNDMEVDLANIVEDTVYMDDAKHEEIEVAIVLIIDVVHTNIAEIGVDHMMEIDVTDIMVVETVAVSSVGPDKNFQVAKQAMEFPVLASTVGVQPDFLMLSRFDLFAQLSTYLMLAPLVLVRAYWRFPLGGHASPYIEI